MAAKIIIFGCLFAAFLLMFRRIRWLEIIRQLMKQTGQTMDEAARQRMLRSRSTLLSVQSEHSLWAFVEQNLQYSGMRRRWPSLTAERWLVGNLVGIAVLFSLLQMITPTWWLSLCGALLPLAVEFFVISLAKVQAMRSVEQNLLKFLDFLGNYSITAGEVTGIFNQISKYVEEPLKSVLDECYYEAQVTGDVGLALLSMGEKIEHPVFKELVRNMEISARYCADFTVLVNGSRRSVREYLRMCSDRKNMLREAIINLVILLGMSLFILVTVDGLIDTSIWQILFSTLPGRIAMIVLCIIGICFVRQIYRMNR